MKNENEIRQSIKTISEADIRDPFNLTAMAAVVAALSWVLEKDSTGFQVLLDTLSQSRKKRTAHEKAIQN